MRIAWYDEEVEHVVNLIDWAFVHPEDLSGFRDNDIDEDMLLLLQQDDAYAHWMMMRTALLSATGKFEEALLLCTGYAGTAGASLKEASAAYALLWFCVEHRLGDVDDAVLEYALSEAYAALPQECTQELDGNLEEIDRLIEQCYMDYDMYAALFEDAGVGEEMRELIETEGSYAHWAAFRSQREKLAK